MTGRPNDEQAPLLERDDQVEAGDTSATPQQKRTWWTIGWYTVFALLGVFILGVFIKGVIDSDDVDFDLGKALKSALGGGLSGAAAIALQVLTLMPLRTIMNYQYRHGTTMTQATRMLYSNGG